MSELSNCRACGGKVSVKARSCPHCGEPDPKTRHWLWGNAPYDESKDPNRSIHSEESKDLQSKP